MLKAWDEWQVYYAYLTYSPQSQVQLGSCDDMNKQNWEHFHPNCMVRSDVHKGYSVSAELHGSFWIQLWCALSQYARGSRCGRRAVLEFFGFLFNDELRKQYHSRHNGDKAGENRSSASFFLQTRFRCNGFGYEMPWQRKYLHLFCTGLSLHYLGHRSGRQESGKVCSFSRRPLPQPSLVVIDVLPACYLEQNKERIATFALFLVEMF